MVRGVSCRRSAHREVERYLAALYLHRGQVHMVRGVS